MAAGVRVQCPDCSLSVVMTSEQDCPPGVSKVVEGTPFCGNCNIPMKPVGSVDTSAQPLPGVSPGLSLAERLDAIRTAQAEVDEACSEWERKKDAAAAAKKVYEGKVETLGVIINRLTSVAAPAEPKPLLELAEEPQACGARHTTKDPKGFDVIVICTLPTTHEGDHLAHGSEPDDVSPPVSWPQTPIEEAAALLADERMVADGEPMCADVSAPSWVGTKGVICSRPKGHSGRHIAHLLARENEGQELASWGALEPPDVVEPEPEPEPVQDEADEHTDAVVGRPPRRKRGRRVQEPALT